MPSEQRLRTQMDPLVSVRRILAANFPSSSEPRSAGGSATAGASSDASSSEVAASEVAASRLLHAVSGCAGDGITSAAATGAAIDGAGSGEVGAAYWDRASLRPSTDFNASAGAPWCAGTPTVRHVRCRLAEGYGAGGGGGGGDGVGQNAARFSSELNMLMMCATSGAWVAARQPKQTVAPSTQLSTATINMGTLLCCDRPIKVAKSLNDKAWTITDSEPGAAKIMVEANCRGMVPEVSVTTAGGANCRNVAGAALGIDGAICVFWLTVRVDTESTDAADAVGAAAAAVTDAAGAAAAAGAGRTAGVGPRGPSVLTVPVSSANLRAPPRGRPRERTVATSGGLCRGVA